MTKVYAVESVVSNISRVELVFFDKGNAMKRCEELLNISKGISKLYIVVEYDVEDADKH